ncbi:MAG: carboxypeptidase regulatory-like domain-containing protein [Planctomycetes bacterium]|nr:carboxypeptidase regulatory-like domain-containing protein [Planctomycetota bacterium]
MSHSGRRSSGHRPGRLAALAFAVAAWLPAQSQSYDLHVVDERGAAVADAVVSRFELDGRMVALGRTDEAGSFATTMEPRSDGRWHMHVAADGLGSVASVSFPAWWGYRSPMPLVLGRGFVMHGRVRDQAGDPVAGARVRATHIRPNRWSGWSPHVEAVSNERGIFSLRGMSSSCSRLTLHADGYRSVTLSPVLAGTPLEFTLEPAPRLVGRVLDSDGRPTQAELEVHYEGRDDPERLQSGEDGRLDLTWRHPTYCRIVARRGYPAESFCSSDVLREPPEELELRLQPLSKLPLLRVRATGDDGVELRDFRAVALWGMDESVPEGYMLQQLQAQGGAARDGVVYQPAASDGPTTGRLLLQARGRAPALVDVDWSPGEDGATEVRIATKPGLRLGGVVKDASGAPLAGVKVWAVRVQENQWQMPPFASPEAVVTGSDGSFVLEGLAPGPTDVFATRRHQSDRPPERLELSADQPAPPVELQLPDLVTVTGRAEGVEVGWRLAFVPPRGKGTAWYGADVPLQALGPFAADGSFSIAGVRPGVHELTLLVPRCSVHGDWLRVPVRTTRIGRDGVDGLEIDAEIVGPTRLRGRVVRGDVLIPLERLLVQQRVVRPENPLRDFQAVDWTQWSATAKVAGDGSYELLVGPGKHELRVIDMVTGIVLKKSPAALDADDDVVVVPDFTLDVGEVTLELRTVTADDSGPATMLRYVGGREEPNFGFSVDDYTAIGLDLRDRWTTQVVYVPAGEGRFVVETSTLPESVPPLRPPYQPVWGGAVADSEGVPLTVSAGESKAVRIDVPRRSLR